MSEALYVSWGGTGRGEALRTAFERVGEAGKDLRYLAILDDDQFGDVSPEMAKTIESELDWLLQAQLRMIDLQTDPEVRSTIDIRQGDVEDVVIAAAREHKAELILLGAPLPDSVQSSRRANLMALIDAIREATGASVEIVGPE